MVPRPMYSQAKTHVSVDGQLHTDWDILGRNQNNLGGGAANNVDADVLGRYSPLASR